MKPARVCFTIGLLWSNGLVAQLIQQGNMLVGSDAVGSAGQGTSVAISADGSTAIVGGQ